MTAANLPSPTLSRVDRQTPDDHVRPLVSVIVVTYNAGRFIAACLESLYARTRGVSFETIVVDNGSRDDTAALIRRKFPQVRLFLAGRNLGFSPANNLALGLARGRYVFLLNPDTVLWTDVASLLAAFLEDHPQAGAAGPELLEEDGRPALFAAREFPGLATTFFRFFGLRFLFPQSRLFGRETLSGVDRSRPQKVPCLTGAALMIPRSVLDEVGLLNEDLPMYFEDLDICARLAASGRELWFLPQARLVHLGGRSTAASPRWSLFKAAETGQAPWLFFRVYRGRFPAGAFTAIVLAGSLLRVLCLCPAAWLARRLDITKGRRLGGPAAEAWTLLRWSLADKKAFGRRFRAFFRPVPPVWAMAGETAGQEDEDKRPRP